MASASTPLIITDTTLAGNPFTPARDSFGVDIAARWKSIFMQTGVVNGEDVEGQAAVQNHKDLYATGEFAHTDALRRPPGSCDPSVRERKSKRLAALAGMA
jgi:hypothetical protein